MKDQLAFSVLIHNYLFYTASKNELKACEITMKPCP